MIDSDDQSMIIGMIHTDLPCRYCRTYVTTGSPLEIEELPLMAHLLSLASPSHLGHTSELRCAHAVDLSASSPLTASVFCYLLWLTCTSGSGGL
jgi:hypothetical protein